MSDELALKLDRTQIQHDLVASGLLPRVQVVESTTSTNADLVAAADGPDFGHEWPHFSALTAEQQTSARGRLGRAWSSPAGTTLSTSVVLRSRLGPGQRHWLSLCAGLALVQVLREDYRMDAVMKWPNDVQVGGRKIAGILAVVPPGDPQAVVLGCGINVLQAPEELPTGSATSLLVELHRAGPNVPRSDTADAAALRTSVLVGWLGRWAQLDARIQGSGNLGDLPEQVRSVVNTLGQQVRVELPDETAVRGRAIDMNDDAALVVEVAQQRTTGLSPEAGGGEDALWEDVPPYRDAFTTGDVVHLRPA